MPKLPRVSGSEVVAALGRLGYRQIRQRGSHIVVQRAEPGGTRTVVVPDHRELTPGTLRSILRKAQIDVETFAGLL